MTNMAQNDEIILININGADRPGVTAALTEILAKNNAVILDIGQADIHNHLSIGYLVSKHGRKFRRYIERTTVQELRIRRQYPFQSHYRARI